MTKQQFNNLIYRLTHRDEILKKAAKKRLEHGAKPRKTANNGDAERLYANTAELVQKAWEYVKSRQKANAPVTANERRIIKNARARAIYQREQAERQAQREAERAQRQAQREAQKAAEQAQREAERAERQAQREAQKAAEQAQREAQKAAEQAQRSATNALVVEWFGAVRGTYKGGRTQFIQHSTWLAAREFRAAMRRGGRAELALKLAEWKRETKASGAKLVIKLIELTAQANAESYTANSNLTKGA